MVYILKNLKQADNASVQPQSLKSATMTPGKHNYNVQYKHKHIIYIYIYIIYFLMYPVWQLHNKTDVSVQQTGKSDKILNARLGDSKAETRCYRQ
jgi:hypothetical protein